VAKDPHLYEIVYLDGGRKFGDRRVLAGVMGHSTYWWRRRGVAAIGRAVMPEFEDVTAEFIKDDDG
jgi:hypothetical protein